MLTPRVPAPSTTSPTKKKSEIERLNDQFKDYQAGGAPPVGNVPGEPETGVNGRPRTLNRLTGTDLGNTPAVEAFRAARENNKKRLEDERRPKGRLATILTSPSGLLDEPNTSRRVLLGY